MNKGPPESSYGTPPSTPTGEYSEDALVEQPAIELLGDLGWETKNLYHEWNSGVSSEGRETDHDVILTRRLKASLQKLNPDASEEALALAIEDITLDRAKMVPARANQELYKLLKDGVKVKVTDEDGAIGSETVKVIDWASPENNDFFVASQFWIQGDVYRRRTDLVAFVNGLPLVLYELKAIHKALKDAYDDNLTDYRDAIPQLFTPNGLVVLSNGDEAVLGSTFADWEYFFDWKRINDEGEEGRVSLETLIMGTCTKERLLDLVESFIVYEEERGGLIKKLAKNHQYLGVNKSIEAMRGIRENQGRLGVFWHTQGSGKSLSMVFFTQKVLRKIKGNWTFVIITDRDELDGQIYKTFAAIGAVTEVEAQATSGKHLQQLLTEDHRYVFTLIQKFQTRDGTPYPMLSERDDIIVITDEAHRTQYDTLALNMRNALPNAAFMGFTGTPLMAGEEKTKEVFGDYVSIYDFARSVEDKATVPLYYENRVPELQLTNPGLNDDLEALLEEAELDEDQERKLERQFSREYQLITRDDRLEKIAEDLVAHFMGRGFRGKAMMVCIDKATTVRMYDKVQEHWASYLASLKASLSGARDEEKALIEAKVKEMEEIDMAVVVSQAQNEVRDLDEKGLDIRPHRKRMVDEDLDTSFKDPANPLRLVFVCAMWITGFDVPSCSTIYLDKPMRNHTLMQAIARANRKYPGKQSGLIVDYANIFSNLQRALAIYGDAKAGGDGPIKDKKELLEFLKQLIAEVVAFVHDHGIDAGAIKGAGGFDRVKLVRDAVDALVASDEIKKAYLNRANAVARVFKAILPDAMANEVAPDAVLISVLAKKIRALTPSPDISHIEGAIEDLLDASIAPIGYVIEEDDEPLFNLSQIDFDKLKEKFKSTRKNTEVAKLRALIEQQLQRMVPMNPARLDFQEKFQKLIDAYNAGSKNITEFFEALIKFAQDLNEEEARAMREGLSEEELAIFDLLTKPEPTLTKKQEAEVKRVCKTLLETLKKEKLVLDWRTRQQSRAAVRLGIEKILDTLPEVYEEDLWKVKCDLTYQHVYSAYPNPGQGVYEARQ